MYTAKSAGYNGGCGIYRRVEYALSLCLHWIFLAFEFPQQGIKEVHKPGTILEFAGHAGRRCEPVLLHPLSNPLAGTLIPCCLAAVDVDACGWNLDSTRKIRLAVRSAQRHQGGGRRPGDSRGAECADGLIPPRTRTIPEFLKTDRIKSSRKCAAAPRLWARATVHRPAHPSQSADR